MSRLKNLEPKVRYVLKNYPRARDNDEELRLKVLEKFYGINPYAPLIQIAHDDSLPSVESLGRARRKIQEKEIELRGTKRKEKIRLEAQKDYIEYALSDNE